MDDDSDLGSVLLGGGLHATDDSFDPFRPGLREEGPEGDDGDAVDDSPIIPNGREGIDKSVEYSDDGYRIEQPGHDGGHSFDQRGDDQPLPWQGAGSQRVVGAAERRDREAADAGNRNVRGASTTHGGGPTAGGTRNAQTHSPRVDSSIDAAAQRIRADLSGARPVDTGRRANVLRALANGADRVDGPGQVKRQYQKQGIVLPPTFLETTFEAMLMGLKANASGDWILTLKIDQDAGQLVFPLHSAFGLALDVSVARHIHRAQDGE